MKREEEKSEKMIPKTSKKGKNIGEKQKKGKMFGR